MEPRTPPMDPDTSEATARQLDLARAQGDSYGEALQYMTGDVDPSGHEVGTHEQPMLWHPMIYHYGRNWRLPADGEYTLRVHVDPPTFMRHDEVNGRRFTEPVDVEFTGVSIERGQD